MMSAFLCLWF